MKLGVCLMYTGNESVEARFIRTSEMGFRYIQFICWKPELFTKENAEYIIELCRKYDIAISAFWCGWTGPKKWNFTEGPTTLGLVAGKYRRTRIKELCLGADFAEWLGVTDIVTHMGFIPENPSDKNFIPTCNAIKKVAEYMKEKGQNLLFESGQETPTAMLRCFETVNTGNLYVNLDTANLILYGKANPVDALDVIGTYVRNVHAKDGFYPTNGEKLGREVRLGDGKVDFPRFIARLKELGYDSHITIEREVGEGQARIDIAYAKEFLESLI